MRAALVAAISAVAILGADAQGSVARYVRIYDAQNDASDYINLELVSVFDCNGNWLRPAGARLSTTYSGSYPATNCINNGTTFCHSQSGRAQWLEIDMGARVAIGKVVVTNRVSCCQNRIVGYTLALFRDADGQGYASPPMSFNYQLASYTFDFTMTGGGGCPTPTEVGMAKSLGLARWIYLNKPGSAILNLNEVMAFDCNGNYISPAVAYLSGTHSSPWVASNCINNGTGSGCHSTGTSPWLQIDLGSMVDVSRIVILNRPDCCQDRIQGFNVGLYAGPNGYQPVFPTQQIRGISASYTLNFPGACAMRPSNIPALAALPVQVSTISTQMAAIGPSQLSILQSELANLNTNTLSTLATELSTLSSMITAETGTVVGGLTATLTATTQTANAVSNAVASMSPIVNSVSTAVIAAQSTADTTTTLFQTLRTAIIGAVADGSSGGGDPTPPQITSDGTSITIASGQCQASNVCDATSFAARLKAAMAAL